MNKEYWFCFGSKSKSKETAEWVVEELHKMDAVARYDTAYNGMHCVVTDEIGKMMIEHLRDESQKKLASILLNNFGL